jgi:hypothetical protein
MSGLKFCRGENMSKYFQTQNLWFKLPDDFNGDITEVFRLMYEYSKHAPHNPIIVANGIYSGEDYEEVKKYIEHVFPDEDKKCYVDYCVVDMDVENKTYKCLIG